MKFPALRPIVTKSSGLSEVPFEMTEEEEEEPNFDIPQSKEEKPAAYPNGPICIYPAGVYLYFEPTAEQAATFDVIVNVAREVQNPFTDRLRKMLTLPHCRNNQSPHSGSVVIHRLHPRLHHQFCKRSSPARS
jgi:tyrosine-protein phosphatase